MIRNLVLAQARLTVVFDPTSSQYRLILLSKDHSASVCFECESGNLDVLEYRPT